MELNVLILAAGLGTRMRSRQAKVLHKITGQPLINHVYRTALALSPHRVMVIVGHQAEQVEQTLLKYHDKLCSLHKENQPIAPEFALQAEQRGTGHAVMMARDGLSTDNRPVLVLSGDVPLIRLETLQGLIHLHQERNAVATVLTTKIADPTGYGRIIRDEQSNFNRIVEHRDAQPAELAVDEINSGIYCFESAPLFAALEKLSPNNAQGEYYLTDVLSILKSAEKTVAVYQHGQSEEVLGINNRIELAAAGQRLRQQKLQELMRDGVTIIDPATTYIDQEVQIGADTIIYPQVIIEGSTTIGENCSISSGVHLISCQLGNDVTIKDHCLISESQLSDQVTIGPFAHLRMGAQLAEGATIGNFVEVKKSKLGKGTKSMHLAYLGDAIIGDKVNIGAGTITCNYDGKNKHTTTIEDNVKIGSDTMLVAPVKVGRGSVTGAGTVVTKDVPEHSLAVGVPAVIKKRLDEK